MIKRWFVLIIAFLLLLGIGGSAFGLEPFQIKTYLTDQAGVIPENQRYQLSAQLKDYADATGNQVLVVIIPSLQGEAPEEYSLKLAKVNKFAEKGQDNAAIILVAVQERKIRFEVGYGLEAVLPDGKTGAIIRDEITPYFKTGDYYGGLAAGIDAVITTITPKYNPAAAKPVRRNSDRSLPWAFLVAMIIGVVSFIGNLGRGVQNQRYRQRRGFSEPWYWGGGGFGGGHSGGGGFSGGGSFGGGGGDSSGSFGGGGSTGGW